MRCVERRVTAEFTGARGRPSTLAATLSRYELANELLEKPYADLIRPNMNTTIKEEQNYPNQPIDTLMPTTSASAEYLLIIIMK